MLDFDVYVEDGTSVQAGRQRSAITQRRMAWRAHTVTPRRPVNGWVRCEVLVGSVANELVVLLHLASLL
jgi:hypothetical protein